jgi:hypothetical protein
VHGNVNTVGSSWLACVLGGVQGNSTTLDAIPMVPRHEFPDAGTGIPTGNGSENTPCFGPTGVPRTRTRRSPTPGAHTHSGLSNVGSSSLQPRTQPKLFKQTRGFLSFAKNAKSKINSKPNDPGREIGDSVGSEGRVRYELSFGMRWYTSVRW